MPLYQALRTSPVVAPSGQTGIEDGRPVKWNEVLAWPAHGNLRASNEHEAVRLAKERWGGSPVIAEIPEPVHYVG
jgi:hypothetical protein